MEKSLWNWPPGTYKFRVDYEEESWVSSDYGFPDSDPLTIKVPVK